LLGDAMRRGAAGDKGYDHCRLRMTPREDKIIVALVDERTAAPHFACPFGFQKMMPERPRFESFASAMRNRRLRNLCVEKSTHSGKATGLPSTPPTVKALIRRWWSAER